MNRYLVPTSNPGVPGYQNPLPGERMPSDIQPVDVQYCTTAGRDHATQIANAALEGMTVVKFAAGLLGCVLAGARVLGAQTPQNGQGASPPPVSPGYRPPPPPPSKPWL